MRASLSALSIAYAVVAGAFGSTVYVVSHPAIGATLTSLPEITSAAADDAAIRMQLWANKASDNYAGQITQWTGEKPRNLIAEWYSPNLFAGLEDADPVTRPQLRSSLSPQRSSSRMPLPKAWKRPPARAAMSRYPRPISRPFARGRRPCRSRRACSSN